ncbi:hypothetical protein [Streptomyces pactum]|uniref:Uncharacterized protein n=1 Tax=Streptomyces pactum TaxID=68249 RepID=A0A1S6JGI6_9ACTN|nr:hypothetical protein [Streptomyces pactum]AQS70866.1 hypothetical protein B1H29_31800 [Streptomyces pactum]
MTAETRLRLAHQARRAKEHQLDDIRRALCDIGFMDDDDPYSHADLAEVIRQNGRALEVNEANEADTDDLTAPAPAATEATKPATTTAVAALANLYGPMADLNHPQHPVNATPSTTSPLLKQIADAIGRTNLPAWHKAARYEAAEAALSVVLPHGKFLGDQLRDAEQRLTAIASLHEPQPDDTGFPDSKQCRTCSRDGGDGYQYLVPWPCPTAQAIVTPADHTTEK